MGQKIIEPLLRISYEFHEKVELDILDQIS